MTDIAAIIFDKDGTLFDFEATWGAWSRGLLADLAGDDADLTARLSSALGYDLAAGRFLRTSTVIAGTVSEVADALLPHLPGRAKAELVAELDAAAQQAPQVGAVDLPQYLASLRAAGLRLGVATNDSEASARVHLAKAGVEEMFDFIAGYDSGFGAKPAPGQLLAFAASVGVAPGRIAMVGDSRHDLAAARAAGMRALAVLTGPARRDDLEAAADLVFDDIGALLPWLGLR